MIELAYFIVGFVMIWGVTALMVWAFILYPLAAALSLTLLKVVGACRAGLWRTLPWHRVPLTFLRTWWEFSTGYIPDQTFGRHFTWSGVFGWEFH